MRSKSSMKILLSSLFVLISATTTFAAVDISLVDNTEEGEVSIVVDSNDEYLTGVDMKISYSADVTIDTTAVLQTEEYCSFLNNFSASEGTISLECLNDSGTKVEGTLATIPYTAETDDYSFQVDTSSLDLGGEDLGEVTNINPIISATTSETTETVDTTDEESSNSLIETVKTFVTENYFYVIAGAFILIAIIILLVVIGKDKEEVETIPSTPENPVM